jgi:hypothetical protein
MVKNRQKGITKAYRNDKKDVDTRSGVLYLLAGGSVFPGRLGFIGTPSRP